jgi:hypothetical protein
MAQGIRRYGPGKFYTLLDNFAYSITLDGGADYEAGYEEGGGRYGFLNLLPGTVDRILEEAIEQGDQLTREEEQMLYDSAAVIFFERSDGIVEADWYDDLRTAEEAWAEIEEEVYDEDEDEED